MAILINVKTRLRIASTNTSFDTDITALIEEAKSDMTSVGITILDDTDPNVISAVVSYCRAYFDLESPNMERWQKVYESKRDGLSLDGDYHVVT